MGDNYPSEERDIRLADGSRFHTEPQNIRNKIPPPPFVEAGMAQSTRCKFCGEFGVKSVPYICPDCWQEIKLTVRQYPGVFRLVEGDDETGC